MSEVELGTLYELNQAMMNNLNPLTPEDLNENLSSIGAWFSSNPYANYYMLLCHEDRNYTILHFQEPNYIQGVREIEELLDERGQVISINYIHDDNAYEIWLRTKAWNPEEGFHFQNHLYMLFEYDAGVVEVSD